MLDAIKGLTASGRRQKQSEDLQGLVAEARAERESLTAALAQFVERRAALTALDDSLRRVDEKAAESVRRLDALSTRLDGLDARTSALTAIDARIQSLSAAAERAQQTVETLGAPGGELGA
jgi:DNA repair ATPase RecN